MAKKLSRIEALRREAESVGLLVGVWSPGDGVTRYRFFKGRGHKAVPYYQSGDGIYTALGIAEAKTFLAGYRRRR